MGLYRRGKIYWFSIRFEGKRIFKSLNTSNRKQAERLYAKIITEMVEGRYYESVKAKSITFKKMVDKYLKKHGKSRDRHTVKRLLATFGDETLAGITTEMIDEYRHLRLLKVKPASIYQELALMRRMFNVARREWKWISYNPVADLSFSVGNRNARDRWLTVDEERRLLDCSDRPAWLRRFLLVALHTGMRRGEILDLKWQDVDLSRGQIMVVKSKNRQKRTIPMSRTLYSCLSAVKIRDISGRVFPVSVRSLRAAYSKATRKAGIRDFRIHDLRHTFATRLVQNGVDLYKVKELLGHKTITMTMRYAHHYPESLRSSIEVLDKCDNSVTVEANAV